ncbi:hypothetical protein AaE_015607 [Aphanomyces astaci]|uniref:Uncharacterized protein n=1 Tax=Aphanomyces astaci TaxID=112090 RepID=A0A6A4Z252_APHAT|nr:hypothetical protein AaE_015607 [Aphanomyces astaci]
MVVWQAKDAACRLTEKSVEGRDDIDDVAGGRAVQGIWDPDSINDVLELIFSKPPWGNSRSLGVEFEPDCTSGLLPLLVGDLMDSQVPEALGGHHDTYGLGVSEPIVEGDSRVSMG